MATISSPSTPVVQRTWEDFQRTRFQTHQSFHPDSGFYIAEIIHPTGRRVSGTSTRAEADARDKAVFYANVTWPCG